MKTNYFAIVSISVLTFGCSGSEETTETPETQTKDTTAQVIPVEEEFDMGASSGYASDWSLFRSAVSDNSWEDFKGFIGPDVSDPEGLLTMLQEDWVMSKMNETPYEDLKDSDYNGTPVKEFVAEVEGSDDEGNTYESAVFLYFEEAADGGLKLVNVLMAG